MSKLETKVAHDQVMGMTWPWQMSRLYHHNHEHGLCSENSLENTYSWTALVKTIACVTVIKNVMEMLSIR